MARSERCQRCSGHLAEIYAVLSPVLAVAVIMWGLSALIALVQADGITQTSLDGFRSSVHLQWLERGLVGTLNVGVLLGALNDIYISSLKIGTVDALAAAYRSCRWAAFAGMVASVAIPHKIWLLTSLLASFVTGTCGLGLFLVLDTNYPKFAHQVGKGSRLLQDDGYADRHNVQEPAWAEDALSSVVPGGE